MRNGFVAALVVATALLVTTPAPASLGNTSPSGDFVHGNASFTVSPRELNFFRVDIAAESGANGEMPRGLMRFVARHEHPLTASVTCVRVIGHNALVTGRLRGVEPNALNGIGFYIEDLTSSGLTDRIGVFFFSEQTISPTQACNSFPFGPNSGTLEEIEAGDFTVRDSS